MGTEESHSRKRGRVTLRARPGATSARLALVVLALGAGCRTEADLQHRLPYNYRVEVDTKRAWVDVEVNGTAVLRLPDPADRTFNDYFSETESRELTPWILEGDNEVTFRVTAADDSGRQHRELEVRKSLTKERTRDSLFISESRELGVFTTTIRLEAPASGCDPLSDTEHDEVLARTQELYFSIARGEFEVFRRFHPSDDPLVKIMAPLVEGSWEISEGAAPRMTPLDLPSLRVFKSCASQAIFVTTKDASPIFSYEFVAPNERTRSANSIRALPFRKIDGAWMLIY